MRSNRLFKAFDDVPNPVLLRSAAAAGRFVIRWDACTTTVVPIEPLEVDDEDARVDLAERYTAWFGTRGGADVLLGGPGSTAPTPPPRGPSSNRRTGPPARGRRRGAIPAVSPTRTCTAARLRTPPPA